MNAYNHGIWLGQGRMNAYNRGIWLGQGRMNAPPTGVPPRNYYRRGGIYAALVQVHDLARGA